MPIGAGSYCRPHLERPGIRRQQPKGATNTWTAGRRSGRSRIGAHSSAIASVRRSAGAWAAQAVARPPRTDSSAGTRYARGRNAICAGGGGGWSARYRGNIRDAEQGDRRSAVLLGRYRAATVARSGANPRRRRGSVVSILSAPAGNGIFPAKYALLDAASALMASQVVAFGGACGDSGVGGAGRSVGVAGSDDRVSSSQRMLERHVHLIDGGLRECGNVVGVAVCALLGFIQEGGEALAVRAIVHTCTSGGGVAAFHARRAHGARGCPCSSWAATP